MKNNFKEYSSEKYFPSTVTFLEPAAPADFKEEIYGLYPETKLQAKHRGLGLVKQMKDRVLALSSHDTKSICYLVISHALVVDEIDYIFDLI